MRAASFSLRRWGVEHAPSIRRQFEADAVELFKGLEMDVGSATIDGIQQDFSVGTVRREHRQHRWCQPRLPAVHR